MGDVFVVFAETARNLGDPWLVVLTGFALVGLVTLLVMARWLWNFAGTLFRKEQGRGVWRIQEGRGDHATITMTHRMARAYQLRDDDVVELQLEPSGHYVLEGMIVRRRPHGDSFTDTSIGLSDDLMRKYKQQASTFEGDIREAVSGEIAIPKNTPFLDHPDPMVRYNNRMTVRVTAWTTLLTTIIAVAIEFAMP